MTADEVSGYKEMKSVGSENDDIDIEKFRKLIRNFIDLRRYQTALFWAEKVVQLSKDDPKDVYWLAQCMFLSKEFHRAAHVIKIRGLEKSNIMCHYLLVESLLEAKEYQEALEVLNTVDSEDLANKSWIHQSDETNMEETEEIIKNDVLASINFLKGKVLEAIDNRTLAMDYYVQALQKSVYCTEALDSLVQHEMLMGWEEKELMEHLPISQQCSKAEAIIVKKLYESKLKKYYDSVQSSTNLEQTSSGNFSESQFVKLFTDKLQADKANKNNKPEKIGIPRIFTPTMQKIMSPANKILSDLRSTPSFSIHSSLIRGEHNKTIDHSIKFKSTKTNITTGLNIQVCNQRLENSIDLLVAKAEKYFYNCEYKKCIKILDDVLKSDPYHTKVLTIQIGCLVELKEFNKLFYVAHKLVDLYPDQAISWYAVGCYYDIIGKSDPARRYLSKATSLDRLFGPAWLAYGHSFARENEHDQAMAAYFKATQLMRGCHLPLLYIGVECGLTKNRDLAEQFFYQAMAIAPLDVFVLHELGVIKFEYNEYKEAEEVFRTTLEMVKNLAQSNNESISTRWEPLLNNLGHCCRKNKKYNEALDFHRRALILKPQRAYTYTAIGFVQALMGNLDDSVDSLHKSLSLKRDDVVATTLLKYAIEDLMEQTELPDILANQSANLETTKKESTNIGNKIKNNWIKLKFDDLEYDSNNSQNSDMGADNIFDMSMED